MIVAKCALAGVIAACVVTAGLGGEPTPEGMQELLDLSGRRTKLLLDLRYVDSRLATLEKEQFANFQRVADPSGTEYSENASDNVYHARATKDIAAGELLLHHLPGIYRVKDSQPKLTGHSEGWYFRPDRAIHAGEEFTITLIYDAPEEIELKAKGFAPGVTRGRDPKRAYNTEIFVRFRRTRHEASKRDGLKVGQPAPKVLSLYSDGDASTVAPLKWADHYTLLVFWSPTEKASVDQIEALRKLHRDFNGRKGFRMVSVATALMPHDREEDLWEPWIDAMRNQPDVVGPTGNPQPFHLGWAQTFEAELFDPKNFPPDADGLTTTSRYQVTELPAAFLIGPGGQMLALQIPVDELRETVSKAISAEE